MGGYGEAGLAGCEFFFPLRDCPDHKGIYPVFGRVLEGLDEIIQAGKGRDSACNGFPIEKVWRSTVQVNPEIIEQVELELHGRDLS